MPKLNIKKSIEVNLFNLNKKLIYFVTFLIIAICLIQLWAFSKRYVKNLLIRKQKRNFSNQIFHEVKLSKFLNSIDTSNYKN